MTKMIGTIRVMKRRSNGEPSLLSFTGLSDESSYKVAKNFNWDKLKNYDQEIIEAWGQIYFEYSDARIGRSQVFSIKKFIIKNDGVSNGITLASLDWVTLSKIFSKSRPWIELKPA